MEIAQTIDEVLFRYYSDKGEPVPKWKVNKNPDWWIEYLKSLDLTKEMNLTNALAILAIPFVCATITFGRFKGETVYYESEDYDGNGTAH